MERANTRVLVVDDEEGIRDLFKVLLEEQGYLCHVASCGDEALEVMSKEPVELAVVDIMMPGMSGLSLYQHIKQVYPHVTVVFVTAVDDLSIAVNHVKDGARDYVVKPVTSERLCRVVEEVLAKRRVALEEARHRKLLEERASRQAEQLEARVRELSSLSRVYQAELSTNTAPEEDSSLERLQVLSDQRLQRSMLAIQETDRKRISEYLHGHVQSKLLALQHRLGHYQEVVVHDPDGAAVMLEDIRAELRSVQDKDIRQASHDLYPSVVKIGLVPALRSLTDRFRGVLDVELSVERDLQTEERRNWNLFPEEFKIGVYRIVEEALDNIIKHAGASTASFFGLLAMKDYAHALGGVCQIESIPGIETRIRATLPVPPAAYTSPGGAGALIPRSLARDEVAQLSMQETR